MAYLSGQTPDQNSGYLWIARQMLDRFVGRTVEKEGIYDGLEIDLVTHDVEKFFRLML